MRSADSAQTTQIAKSSIARAEKYETQPAATRKAPLAATRPTIDEVYMIDAGTCCADARYGSHVHQPEAASAENQRRVTQPVVRSIAHPKSAVGSIRCAHDLQAARPPPSLAAAAAPSAGGGRSTMSSACVCERPPRRMLFRRWIRPSTARALSCLPLTRAHGALGQPAEGDEADGGGGCATSSRYVCQLQRVPSAHDSGISSTASPVELSAPTS